MSQSQHAAAAPLQDRADSATEPDAGAVLAALGDDDCRRILDATDDDARTASELADACDVPLSTTYRKLDRLTDAGLLREAIRVRADGKHTTEYVRDVEDVVVTVPDRDGGDLELSVTHREPRDDAPGRRW